MAQKKPKPTPKPKKALPEIYGSLHGAEADAENLILTVDIGNGQELLSLELTPEQVILHRKALDEVYFEDEDET